jgi:hypothetical protein
LHNHQESRSHFKILSTRRVIWSNFHTEDPIILVTGAQNLFARALWGRHLCTAVLHNSFILFYKYTLYLHCFLTDPNYRADLFSFIILLVNPNLQKYTTEYRKMPSC